MNPDPRLAELEASIMGEVNRLGIGTMGFGGRVSLIGCKVGALTACRRVSLSLLRTIAGHIAVVCTRCQDRRDHAWLYRDAATPVVHMADQSGFPRTGREVALRTPLTEEQVRSLKVGDVVLVSGAPTPAAMPHHHPDARAACGLARRDHLSLRARRREGRQWLARDCGWSDDEHS